MRWTRVSAGIAAVALLWSVSPREAAACSCVPKRGSLPHAMAAAENVLQVKILKRQPAAPPGKLAYLARARRVYKGCIPRYKLITLHTPDNGALCGVGPLEAGETYVLAAGPGGGRGNGPAGRIFEITLCDTFRRVDTLTSAEEDLLHTEARCCGEACKCADARSVDCPAAACDPSHCPGATSCETTQCGDCIEEFFDAAGMPLCTPCAGFFDCALGQECGPAGVCIPAP